MDLAFLLCVERGRLEAQTVLFCESLREWGGSAAEAPTYAVSPRPGHEPTPETVARLEQLGVSHVAAPLNRRLPEKPHTNKVYAAAWAERELDHEKLVFCDSDTVFLNEPAELLSDDWVAAARPVGAPNAGSTGEGDPNEPAWEDLYATLGVSARPFVETIVKRVRIRAYLNAGLVAVRREAGLFSAWRDALERLLDAGYPDRHRRVMRQLDQLALAGVLAQSFDRVLVLPETYNYPLPKRIKLPPEMQALDLDRIVHLHGHRWLHLPGFLGEVHPPLDQAGERYHWLDERLPLEPTIDEPFRFPKGAKPEP